MSCKTLKAIARVVIAAIILIVPELIGVEIDVDVQVEFEITVS